MARKGLSEEGTEICRKRRSQEKSTRGKGNRTCKGPGAGTGSGNLKVSELRVMGGSTADKVREMGRGQVRQSLVRPVIRATGSHGGVLLTDGAGNSFMERS